MKRSKQPNSLWNRSGKCFNAALEFFGFESFEFSPQRSPVNAQDLSRIGTIPGNLSQHPKNIFFFFFFQGKKLPVSGPWYSHDHLLEVAGEMIHLDTRPLGEGDRPFDDVFKLPNISGKFILH